MSNSDWAAKSDERTLVIAPSGPVLADTVLDAWGREATFALLKPSAPAEHRSHVINAFDPHVIATIRGEAVVFVRREANSTHPEPVAASSVTVFTSGTTGMPKGVVLPRASVVGNASKTAALHGFGLGRPHGTCLDLFHVNALVMSLIGSHLFGERLVMDYSGDPVSYFQSLKSAGARTASVNPMHLRRIVEAGPTWPDDLDYLITAAGPCSAALARAFFDRYGPRLRQGYGTSEAVNFSFVMPVLGDADFKELYLEQRPPVGLPLPETEFEIDDGELWIRTPDRMAGYLGSSAQTTITSSGWMSTGDSAVVRDGFVVLLGRTSEAVHIGRGRISPVVLEERLDLEPTSGEHAVFAVTRRDGSEAIGLHAAGAWTVGLMDRIAEPGPVPLVIARTGQIALSPSGKVQRHLMSSTGTQLLGELAALVLDLPESAWRDPSRWPLARLVSVLLGIEIEPTEQCLPWPADGSETPMAGIVGGVLVAANRAEEANLADLVRDPPNGLDGLVVVGHGSGDAAAASVIGPELRHAWNEADLVGRSAAVLVEAARRCDVLWARCQPAEGPM